MFSGQLVCQSLYLDPMSSLPVVCGGVSCSVRLCGRFLVVPGRLHRRGVRPAPVLKCFLFVLLQGAIDGILNQSPADPEELCLVRLGPATPTWVDQT